MGFSVGVVDKDKILDPSTQNAGDVMIAIKSSRLITAFTYIFVGVRSVSPSVLPSSS